MNVRFYIEFYHLKNTSNVAYVLKALHIHQPCSAEYFSARLLVCFQIFLLALICRWYVFRCGGGLWWITDDAVDQIK